MTHFAVRADVPQASLFKLCGLAALYHLHSLYSKLAYKKCLSSGENLQNVRLGR